MLPQKLAFLKFELELWTISSFFVLSRHLYNVILHKLDELLVQLTDNHDLLDKDEIFIANRIETLIGQFKN